ncbi:hypothetical protein FJT64_001103 [Amphibalanus amphitrite]|uniref:Fibrinogen C-terminal domain-containing protein n=1 Tax=Amphibalanus amphitrite TaxID=1232801 RepID=A0A6A4VIZ9_AMPAM|nr:hypothetical protein FJT64_001103 [Amphibalanus amphitrite]
MWPTALPIGMARYQEPEIRACARSCLQLRNQGGAPRDGVYWFTGMPAPVLCDFSHDGGGWTLLVTANSQTGWDMLSIFSRNPLSPSFTDNYSILGQADAIRDLGNSSRFAYRIEAQAAERGRRHWGGVWSAPRHYSFVDVHGLQTDVELVTKFDSWQYQDKGIEERMPWLRGGLDTVLTTSSADGDEWWGTLVISRLHSDAFWKHAPWIDGPEEEHSGTVLYWMREEEH